MPRRSFILTAAAFTLAHLGAIVVLQVLGVSVVAGAYSGDEPATTPAILAVVKVGLRILGSPLGWLQGPERSEGLNRALLFANSGLWGVLLAAGLTQVRRRAARRGQA